MTGHEITNSIDIIDSRDVIERIEELEGMDERDEEEEYELKALRALADEASGSRAVLPGLRPVLRRYATDWNYGQALIRDSYFEEYARELAGDIGAIEDDAGWPNRHIDWEAAADELKQDYTSVDFDGVTYWIR